MGKSFFCKTLCIYIISASFLYLISLDMFQLNSYTTILPIFNTGIPYLSSHRRLYLIVNPYFPLQKHVFILLYYPPQRILIVLTPTQKIFAIGITLLFALFQFSEQNLVCERITLKVDEKNTLHHCKRCFQ